MYGPNQYVKYNRWRDNEIDALTDLYDNEEIDEDEYTEALEKLTYDDFMDLQMDREG